MSGRGEGEGAGDGGLRPPRSSEALLRWVLRRTGLGPSPLGDLREEHREIVARRGRRAADRWHRVQAARLAARLLWERRGTGGGGLGGTLADVGYALRRLRRAPGFTAVTVLTLAFGVGATTSIFSVTNAVVLRGLPYPEPERLVSVWEQDRTDPVEVLNGLLSHPNFTDVRESAAAFESIAQYRNVNLTLSGMGAAELVPAGQVTADFFRVFGVAPILGRGFTEEEARYGGPHAVVVSEAFWRSRLGADPNAIGRTITLQGTERPIVGVAPAAFDFPSGARLWVPMQNDDESCGRGCVTYAAVGRLAPGATIEGARAELAGLASALEAQHPTTNARTELPAAPLQERIVGDVKLALWIMLGAVGMVLLIACANVANLILVRGGGRRAELAVRTALGAPRSRVVRQLMIENAVLAVLGGAAGVALAGIGVEALLRLAPESLPRMDEVTLDGSTLLFSLGVVAATAVIFGLGPALRLAGEGISEGIGQGGRGRTGERGAGRVREMVLASQVALSVMLLLGAGLLLRSLAEMRSVELGLDPSQVAVFRLSLPDARYPGPDDVVRFIDELESRLAGIPGAEGVSTVVAIPFGTASLAGGFRRMDQPPPEPGEGPSASYHAFDADAFEVLGVRVAQGRGFEPGDRWGSEPVAMIDRTTARLHFPGEDPVGKEIDVAIGVGYPEDRPRRIVGVVEDFRTSLSEGETPRMIVPYAQAGAGFPHLAIRYSGVTGASVLMEAREVLQALDPELPMSAAMTLEEMVAEQTAGSRFYLLLIGVFAGMAVVLAAVGIYGLVAYLVARRTSEIAMRLALGAGIDRVIRMVVWQGVRPALIGIVLGLAGAVALRRVIAAMLYGVEPTDPVTIAGTAAVLLAVVAAATALPARRASRIPPAEALRGER